MTTERLRRDIPIVCVVGFTASGKTALGMHLARRFNGEIIAADAMTVYKDFDIGTAKPTRKEQSEIQHHLLSSVHASESFSAAKFKYGAQKAIDDIASRNKLPIIVGGSGLYVDSVLYNYEFRKPPQDKKTRAALNDKTRDELIAIAGAKKLNLESVDINNKRRLIRAIESNGEVALPSVLRENTLILGLNISKEELKTRVQDRTDSMFERGLEKEVRKLSSLYGWEVAPMRSIGYKEWTDYFKGSNTENDVKKAIILHTMQLAKKQGTWFRRNKHIRWMNNFNEAVEYTTTFLNK